MNKRTQRRIQAAVPIQIRGTDAQGEDFEETTEALDVSRRGLVFRTRRDIPLFASLRVTIPGRGPTVPGEGPSDFFCEAAVVRVEKEADSKRVAVRFVGATLSTYTSEGL